MPLRVGHRRFLNLAQHRAGLDQMRVAGKTRCAHRAQGIAGQRSAARPELGVDRVARRSGAFPAVGERGADDLAEHLADFRRRGEIAARAERIAGRVIISVAGLHIGLDGDRPFAPDAFAKRAFERRHATEAEPRVGSTRTRRFLAVSIR